MKNLLDLTNGNEPLNEKITLFVPSTNATKEQTQKFVRYIAAEFSELFGGCTITNGVGTWKDEKNELIEERVYLCTSSMNELTNDQKIKVISLARLTKTKFSQDCVSLEVNNVLYFI